MRGRERTNMLSHDWIQGVATQTLFLSPLIQQQVYLTRLLLAQKVHQRQDLLAGENHNLRTAAKGLVSEAPPGGPKRGFAALEEEDDVRGDEQAEQHEHGGRAEDGVGGFPAATGEQHGRREGQPQGRDDPVLVVVADAGARPADGALLVEHAQVEPRLGRGRGRYRRRRRRRIAIQSAQPGQQMDQPALGEHDVVLKDAHVGRARPVTLLEGIRVVKDALFGKVAPLLPLLQAVGVVGTRQRQVVCKEVVDGAGDPLLVPGRVLGGIRVRDEDVEEEIVAFLGEEAAECAGDCGLDDEDSNQGMKEMNEKKTKTRRKKEQRKEKRQLTSTYCIFGRLTLGIVTQRRRPLGLGLGPSPSPSCPATRSCGVTDGALAETFVKC